MVKAIAKDGKSKEVRKAVLIRPKKSTLSFLASKMLESGYSMNDVIEMAVMFCKGSKTFKLPKKESEEMKKHERRLLRLEKLRALAEGC